jgi:hypothetical protein
LVFRTAIIGPGVDVVSTNFVPTAKFCEKKFIHKLFEKQNESYLQEKFQHIGSIIALACVAKGVILSKWKNQQTYQNLPVFQSNIETDGYCALGI